MTTLDVTEEPASPDIGTADREGQERRDWLAGRSTSWADVAIAAGMGVVVIIVAYIFRSNIVPTDPWHYVRSGMHFPSTTWVPLGYTRYGIVIPSGVIGHFFPDSPFSYYVWPLLSSGVLVAAVALLARRFWGWTAAVVAVLLLVGNRVVFYNLSRGYPDLMATAIFTVAVVCALIARDRLVTHRRAAPWLLAVGFLLGWSFEVRESAIVGWPLIALILWRRGSLLRSIILVSLPVLFWAALDLGISAIAYGDPLLKLHVLSGLGGKPSGQKVSTASIADHTWLVGQSRWTYLMFVPKAALKTDGGIWMVALGALALVALVVKNWGVRLMAAWFVLVYLLTVAPTGLLDPSHPRARIDVERYWIPFFPGAALAVAGLVAVVASWLAARYAGQRRDHAGQRRDHAGQRRAHAGLLSGVVLAAAVCVGPVVYTAQYAMTNVAFAPHGSDGLEDLRDHLRGRDFHPQRVWTDWETARILPIYQHDFFGGRVWSGKPQSLTGRAQPRPGEYAVLFSPTAKTCAFCRDALRPWLKKQGGKPPASWHREYVSPDGTATLYRIG